MRNERDSMKRGLVILGVVLAGTVLRAEMSIVAPRDIPAYSLSPPHEQRGLFPQGATLRGLDGEVNGLVRVRFLAPSGRVVEALCQPRDVKSSGPAASAASPPAVSASAIRPTGSFYSEPEWLEDAEGHKRAAALQSKYDNQMLIFFYADWNEACQFLWEKLLNTSDFKKQTAHVVKLKVNPEHGKEEGQVAAKYNLRKYPSTFVIDKPFAKPRNIDLVFWSFGKMKTLSVEKSLLEIAGGTATQQVQQAGGVTNEPAPAD